jgi:transcriptional regulator with XRE-family HTH domain
MTEQELEHRRRMAGLTMADLASRAGVPYSRVWHGLRGTRLSPDELRKLERAVHYIEEANVRTAAV